jgi:hypothetical protein
MINRNLNRFFLCLLNIIIIVITINLYIIMSINSCCYVVISFETQLLQTLTGVSQPLDGTGLK